MYRLFGKRLFDIVSSLLAFIFLFPILLIVSIAIKVFDPGPVIFKQKRVGVQGKEFWFYKFRSMPVNTGNVPSDRVREITISTIGKLLRRTNLDELPQLFNILKGDMSIVGPRPPITSQDELIKERKANGALMLRPGLTGLAQVNSFDGMSVMQKAEFDGLYSEKVSFLNDLRIIVNTFTYLLKPPPTY